MNPGLTAVQLSLVTGLLSLLAFALGQGVLGSSRAPLRRLFHRFGLASYGVMSLSLGIASALLLQAFLRNDFRYEYVVSWSSRDQAVLYKVSGFWAGQEGSFLFWALCIALIGWPLVVRIGRNKASVSSAYLLTQVIMLFLLWWEHPFTRLTTAPPDGHGLNPLLQDPWMAVHPPVIFIGYAAMGIPFALAVGALVRREYDAWTGSSLRWSLVCMATLGAGIVMGAYWAYKVLGWGGYWAWDPVENASLVPWLTAVALVHGLVAQRRRGAFRRTNLALALVTYLLTLYATFLTRSGILAKYSPHSFAASEVFGHMKWLLGALLVLATVLFIWRCFRVRGVRVPARPDRAFVVGGTLLFLLLSAAFVLFGTSWPILSRLLLPQPQEVGKTFYNLTHAPIWTVLALFLVLGASLAWRSGTWAGTLRASWPSWAVGVLLAAAVVAWLDPGAVFPPPPESPPSAWPPAAWYLFRGLLVLLLAVGGAAAWAQLVRLGRDARIGWGTTGAALAHLGLALCVVGIVVSSAFSQKAPLSLVEGESKQALGRTFTFRGERRDPGEPPTHRWEIEVAGPRGSLRGGAPRFDPQHQIRGDARSQKPAIIRSPGGDLYLAPLWKVPWRLDLVEVTDGLRVDPSRLPRSQVVLWNGYYLIFRGFLADHEGETFAARLDVVGRGQMQRLTPVLQGEPVYLPGPPGESRALIFAGMHVESHRASFLVEPTLGSLFTFTAATKPLIGVLWLGILLACLGTLVAIVRRFREVRHGASLS